tara:strand:+ start:938 stop:1159 length:222 start_codon:yes stop_codon:yes gene_type:complete
MQLPDELILAQPRQAKIELLTHFAKKKAFLEWAQISTVLLDAPISKGGLETDIIKDIWDKYNSKAKSKSSNNK